ncbi:MAG: S41 family peptidase [Deltaproteobacteria bacterium]|nr:S41 family peptidase [Deltaproteobacteria bacterium]
MKLFLKSHKKFIGLTFFFFIALCVLGSGLQQYLLAGTEKTYEELKIFSDVLDIIEKNYVDPIDSKKLIEGAIQGMVESLDPHSSFLSPDVYKELQIETKGEFSGVGIVITMKDNVLTVISPIEGSPAHRAGIKAGDQIIKVDGEYTRDMKMWEAVKKMRGKKGTSVVITIVRKGLAEPKDFTIVRDIIPLESVRSYLLKPGYGYVRITNFRDNTYRDVKTAIKKLESGRTPLKGLILDLRDNPGGLLNQAVKVADIFLEKGRIVSIKGRSKAHSKVYSAHREKEERHPYPIVLLINEGSASASEIVAGALQDHNRALVLGTTSFGKGSVQAVEPLRGGAGLKLTIARYYTPKGHAIQAKGIKPDLVVEQTAPTETEAKEQRYLKEKDLKNHLPARPKEGLSKEAREELRQLRGVKVPDQEPSEAVKDILAKDNQVRIALEILTSWQKFSKMPY